MTRRSRRRAKKRPVTFRLVVDAQEMIVPYHPKCVTLNVPLRFTAMMSRQSLSTASASPAKALRRLKPASLTRTEIVPIFASTSAAIARQAA